MVTWGWFMKFGVPHEWWYWSRGVTKTNRDTLNIIQYNLLHTHIDIYIYNIYIHTHIYIYNNHMCFYLHICIYIYEWMCEFMHVWMSECRKVWMENVCKCTCICNGDGHLLPSLIIHLWPDPKHAYESAHGCQSGWTSSTFLHLLHRVVAHCQYINMSYHCNHSRWLSNINNIIKYLKRLWIIFESCFHLLQ